MPHNYELYKRLSKGLNPAKQIAKAKSLMISNKSKMNDKKFCGNVEEEQKELDILYVKFLLVLLLLSMTINIKVL